MVRGNKTKGREQGEKWHMESERKNENGCHAERDFESHFMEKG